MKALGIDFGTKYVGLSISDPDMKIAFPRDKVEFAKAIPYISKFIKAEDIGLVVLGKPLNMQGNPTKMSEQVEIFKKDLQEAGIKAEYQDERLSSKFIDKSLQAMNINTRQRRDVKDALEATAILQLYLDTVNNRMVNGENARND